MIPPQVQKGKPWGSVQLSFPVECDSVRSCYDVESRSQSIECTPYARLPDTRRWSCRGCAGLTQHAEGLRALS